MKDNGKAKRFTIGLRPRPNLEVADVKKPDLGYLRVFRRASRFG